MGRLALFGIAAIVVIEQTAFLLIGEIGGLAGKDYRLYMEATRTWLAGGSFYPAYQLAGPYEITWGQILYPPQMLALFAPFTFLPAILWWAIPVAITVGMIAWWRPGAWTLAAVLIPVAMFPVGMMAWVSGTPTIWFVAAVALATRWPAASAFVFLKPTLLPFALLGVRSRWWWAWCVVGVALTVAMLPLVLDWITVMRNATGPLASPLYSIENVPLLVMPLIPWAVSRASRLGAPGYARSRGRTASDPAGSG